jgi:hypothetical protein
MPISSHDDLLANPRELFLRPHLFIVCSEANDEDLALARSIAQQCAGFTRPQCGTVVQLRQRSLYGRIYLGITLVILSPAMLAEPVQRTALMRQMRYAFKQTLFQHYCVCRGVSAEQLKKYPDLEPLLENVMVGDGERSLPAILSELHDFATHVLPASPELKRPVSELFYRGGLRRTLAAFALALLMLVGWVSMLAKPAAIALAAFWWQKWTPWGTEALALFAAFYGGYRLNHLQSIDMWPWLRQSWKLPRNGVLSARRPPRPKAYALGPVAIAGVLVAASYIKTALSTGDNSLWFDAGICFLLGCAVQSLLDYINICHLIKTLPIGNAAVDALPSVETADAVGTRLTLHAMFTAAGGVAAAFFGALLLTVVVSALMLAAALLAGLSARPDALTGIIVAAVVGFFVPALLERFAHSGITYLGEYTGIGRSSGNLFARLAGNPNTTLTLQGVPAKERPLVETFLPSERPLVLQWLNSLRMGLRSVYRRWQPAPDYVSISYAWSDNALGDNASPVAAACKATGIDAFLDKLTVHGQQGVFRMPIAAGLSKCTHFFLIVTPGVDSGNVVRQEIEMAMGRWRSEMLPPIICVVEPAVRDKLVADPAVPLPLRFLLTFCPQMTPAEASDPALVRYIIELTRRQGKWSDWRVVLSPSTAIAQILRLRGTFDGEESAVR